MSKNTDSDEFSPKQKPMSMVHWNGNMICAIDTETTGLDPAYHEIWQIAILPLDADFNIRRDVIPFYINIAPEYPERIDPEAIKVSRVSRAEIMKGHDREKAKDLLEDWKNKLGLPVTKFGSPCKIIPLGQNYFFDMPFLKHWLGISLYDSIFHYHPRDTMATAIYLNDRAACHAEEVPFSKVGLTWLARKLGVEMNASRAHDALSDCQVTAGVYKALVNQGLFE